MGFSIIKEFPSRFLSGDEVEGHEISLTIRDVKKEKAFNKRANKEGEVLVVYFDGKDRGIRLGKERAKELVEATGSNDTDGWKGQKVIAYTVKKLINKQNVNVLHFKTV